VTLRPSEVWPARENGGEIVPDCCNLRIIKISEGPRQKDLSVGNSSGIRRYKSLPKSRQHQQSKGISVAALVHKVKGGATVKTFLVVADNSRTVVRN